MCGNAIYKKLSGGVPLDVWPVPVDFTVGEQPESVKFDAWAEQTRKAFLDLQRVLGDAKNTSNTEASFLLNLTSAIGSMAYLGPHLPYGQTFTFRETIASSQREVELTLEPTSTATLDNTDGFAAEAAY